MRVEIRPTEPSILAVLLDEQFSSDAPALDLDNLAALKRMAETGQLFFMHADDPASYSLDVYVDEPPPEDVEIYFTTRSGSFLLRAPTGRLLFEVPAAESDASHSADVFTHAIEVPAGDYVVSVRNRAQANISAHEDRVKRTVGTSDWRFYQRLNWTGAVGCLAVGLAALLALVPAVRHDYWPLLLPFALPTLFYLLVARLPRYRRVKIAEEELSKSLPVYLLVLNRVSSANGLSGGWYGD